MLHQLKSNKLNVLKHVLILPLLTLFLMSFNTKDIYLNKNYSNITQNLEDIEMVIINKDFRDDALEKVKSEFKVKDVDLQFKSIKRNDKNEIIAIQIEGTTKKKKTNYSSSSSEAIKPIKITYNSKDESISISTIENHKTENIFDTENGTHKIVQSGSNSNFFIIDEDADKHNFEITTVDNNSKNTKVIVKRNATVIDLNEGASENKEKVIFITKNKDGKEIKEELNKGKNKQTWVVEEGGANDINIFKTEMKDNKLSISTEAENSLLIFIDEKESTKEEMEKLDPNNIASMQVFKGEKMIRKYGERAKDGVIRITTK